MSLGALLIPSFLSSPWHKACTLRKSVIKIFNGIIPWTVFIPRHAELFYGNNIDEWFAIWIDRVQTHTDDRGTHFIDGAKSSRLLDARNEEVLSLALPLGRSDLIAHANAHAHAHVRARAYTHTHTHTHTHTQTHTHAHTHIHIHTHTHTHTHTHMHTHACTHTRIHIHTHPHTRIRAHTHTHTHTYTHTHTHTHTNTQTHTHTHTKYVQVALSLVTVGWSGNVHSDLQQAALDEEPSQEPSQGRHKSLFPLSTPDLCEFPVPLLFSILFSLTAAALTCVNVHHLCS